MLFEFVRKLLCPFEEIEKLVPSKGSILDVGCGHGIFSELLATKHKSRKVLGIDPSPWKIELAKKREHKNLEFKVAYLDEINGTKFDAIVIIDVLYLLPQKERISTLRYANKLLKKKGELILKTDSREPKWLAALLPIEETIMVKLTKLTHSDHKKVYFLTKSQYLSDVKAAGFKIEKEYNFVSTFPYRHPTFVAKKE